MKRSPIKRSQTPLSRNTPLRSRSVLKTSVAAAERPKSTLRAIGKKGSAWIKVRKELKKRFEWAGITTCELKMRGCWFNDGLSFCHSKKRRKMQDLDIWRVCLGCLHCHGILDEKMSHEEMEQTVENIIEKRGLLVPPLVLQQIQRNQDGS